MQLITICIIALCISTCNAFGQGSWFDRTITTSATNVPAGTNSPMLSIPGAIVTVCGYPATFGGGGVCSNTASIYADSSLTVPAANPITADGQGKIGFWAAAANYTYTVQTPRYGVVIGTYVATIGGAGGASYSGTGPIQVSGTVISVLPATDSQTGVLTAADHVTLTTTTTTANNALPKSALPISAACVGTDSSRNPITGTCGTGTVSSTSVVTANGVSGTVANPTSAPAITLSLGAITPTSVAAAGSVSGSSLSTTGASNGAVTLGYTGTAATAPGTNAYQVQPILPITTPWIYSPAQAPYTGVPWYTLTGNVAQETQATGAQLATALGTNVQAGAVALTAPGAATQTVTTPVNFGSNSNLYANPSAGYFGTLTGQVNQITNPAWSPVSGLRSSLGTFTTVTNMSFASPNPSVTGDYHYISVSAPGHSNGNGGSSSTGWTVSAGEQSYVNIYQQGIGQGEYLGATKTAIGDFIVHNTRVNYFGGATAASDESTVIHEDEIFQLPWLYGPITAGATTGSNLITITPNAGGPQGGSGTQGAVFPDGGVVMDVTKGGTMVGTISSPAVDNTLHGAYVTVTGFTPTASTAIASMTGASCSPNGDGVNRTIYSTTCPVTSVTGTFTTGLACASGPWSEQIQITAVSGGNITFNTLHAWNTSYPSIVAQGGVCGQGFIPTGMLYSGWPVHYELVGAIGQNLYYSSCKAGPCNTINSNSLASGLSITLYPEAEITGTNLGTSNQANLAYNAVPFATGDTIIAPPQPSASVIMQRQLLQANTPSPCVATGGVTPTCPIQIGNFYQQAGAAPWDVPIFFNNINNTSITNPWGTGLFYNGSFQDDIVSNYFPVGALWRINGNLLTTDANPTAKQILAFSGQGGTTPANLYFNTTNGQLRWDHSFAGYGVDAGVGGLSCNGAFGTTGQVLTAHTSYPCIWTSDLTGLTSATITSASTASNAPFNIFDSNLVTNSYVASVLGYSNSSGNEEFWAWYHTGTGTGIASWETFGNATPMRIIGSQIELTGPTRANSNSTGTTMPAACGGAFCVGNGSGTDVMKVSTAGVVSAPAYLPSVLYSASGTALPTCAVGLKGQGAIVSDATSPTYMGAYTSGGAITAAVICSYNGTTYTWLTH